MFSNKTSMAVSISVSTLDNAALVKEDGNVPSEGVTCKLLELPWDKPLTSSGLLPFTRGWKNAMSAHQLWAQHQEM